MTDWTSGYVADIGYTFGYYQELNPLRVKLAFLDAGVVCPEIGTACELGFGQGMNANLHAAASITSWYGTDFNPAQAGFAQELAEASGAGARLHDEAFAEFASRADLPDFDFISLHGIWSWISDENRAVIVDFIRRKLKVGGVLYISYNTQPGWANFAPMRHLMAQHADTLGARGQGTAHRIQGALEFTEKLLATHPAYARANPQIFERIKQAREQNPHYLAHEYFNRDWHPMHFSTMSESLLPAKLNYVCSAHYFELVDTINLSAEQRAFLKEIPDEILRESVRDFMVNQPFRRDYWVKGARKLNPLEQAEALRAQKVMLISPRPDVTLKVTGALGEANMSEAIYHPLLDLLADHQVKTLGQLEQALAGQGIVFAQILEAAFLLIGMGHLASVQDEAIIARARKSCDRINRHLMNKARGSGDIVYLASPVTGGGINIGRFQQLFLLAISQGKTQPAEWAQSAWQDISWQGRKIVKDGQPLATPEENLAELNYLATVFAEKRVPILKAQQII